MPVGGRNNSVISPAPPAERSRGMRGRCSRTKRWAAIAAPRGTDLSPGKAVAAPRGIGLSPGSPVAPWSPVAPPWSLVAPPWSVIALPRRLAVPPWSAIAPPWRMAGSPWSAVASPWSDRVLPWSRPVRYWNDAMLPITRRWLPARSPSPPPPGMTGKVPDVQVPDVKALLHSASEKFLSAPR